MQTYPKRVRLFFMPNLSRLQAEKYALGIKTGSTGAASLHDLRVLFFGPTGSVSQRDSVRAYLQFQTGLTGVQSLSDLWRQFFLGKGVVNQVSLTDMANQFFTLTGF